MAVLINGIDIPNYCYDCTLCHEDDESDWSIIYRCMPLGAKRIEDPFEKNKDCPLIEVKEPYGRLIDADALNKVFDANWDDSTWRFTSKVDDAPTLVPSWYTERHVIQELEEELERLREEVAKWEKDMRAQGINPEEYLAARPMGAFQAEPEERCCCDD